MPSLQEELSKSLYLYTSGSSIEAVRGEDGVTRAMVVEEIPGAGVAAEDQTDPFAIAGEVEPVSVGELAEKTGEMAAGAVGGAGAVTLGLPGDLIGLAEGLYGAATSEEGERLDAFLQNMATRSEQMGSAMTIGTLEEMIQGSDLSPQTKENMLAGSKYLGEWAELPGGFAAASALLRGARNYAAGAPARVAERGTGTTLQSGVDPMAAVDEAIVGIQNVTGTGARAPVEKDQLGFVQKALEVTKNLQQKRGTAQQFLKRLTQNGVSEDEIQALGLREEFSNLNERITRDQFEQTIRDRRIELEEVVRDTNPSELGPGETDDLTFNAQEPIIDPAEWQFRTEGYIDELEAGDEFTAERIVDYMRANSNRFDQDELNNLQQQLSDGQFNDLPSTIKSDIEEAADFLAQEEYMQDPYFRVRSDDADYEIVGNDEMGYTVLFEGRPVEDATFNSLGEAQIQARDHAYRTGIITDRGEFGDALFEEHMMPGGDDYEEVLIKDPSSPGAFEGDHWAEGNVIGHALTTRRTDSQGRAALYAEEIQSDWAQRARKALSSPRYKSADARIKENQELIDNAKQELKSYGITDQELNTLPSLNSLSKPDSDLTEEKYMDLVTYIRGKEENISSAKKGKQNIEAEAEEYKKMDEGTRFVKDTQQWLRPTIKRLIARAIEQGLDAVAVPPARLVHARWNDDYGDFYRKTVPNTLLKAAKQLDPNAKITRADFSNSLRIGNGTDEREIAEARELGIGNVQIIEITPAMRKAYEQKGQSLFVGAPTAIIGGKMAFDAATREQEDDSR